MTWIAFAWLLLTGFGIVHSAIPRGRISEKLGLAFPLSTGLHGTLDFALMQGWGASVFWSALFFSPFLFPVIRVRHRTADRWTWRQSCALAFISLAVLQVWVHVIITPAYEWDSVSTWLFKGKALATEGKLTPDIASRFRGPHLAYPWNVPMIYAWLGRVKGHYSEDASKGVSFAYFSCLLMILYSLARLKWPRTQALLFVAAYSAIPYAAVIAFNRDADIIFETLIAAVVFLILRYQIHQGLGNIGLLAVAVFLCCWTKVEGIAFCVALLLPYLLFLCIISRRLENRWLFLGALAGSIAGFAAFWIPKRMLGAEGWFERFAPPQGLFVTLLKFAGIAETMLGEMAQVSKWNLVWFLVPVLVWLGRDPYKLKFLFLAHVALYFAVYFFSPYPWEWQMSTSVSRVLTHTLPTLFAWTIFAFPRAESE